MMRTLLAGTPLCDTPVTLLIRQLCQHHTKYKTSVCTVTDALISWHPWSVTQHLTLLYTTFGQV